jgi:hypothetical protein
MKLIIGCGVGFVIACILAVKYGPWFKKTSTTVTDDVTNAANNIKNEVTTNAGTPSTGS